MRDQQSFDEFYVSRAGRLIRLIFARTGDWQRAEECVQEAFVRAWQRWRVLDHDDPHQWVLVVAWRLAVRDWHRSKREAAAWAAFDSAQRPPRESVGLGQLREVVRELPQSQGDVLLLHYLEDLSVREVAAVLDLPQGTVKSHLSRGRKSLARILSEDASQ